MQISKTSKQPAAGRRKKTRRPSFRHWWKKARPLTFVLLCVIAAVMLIPIVFTFLYSFFPKSEISDYLNQRSSYDTSKWLPVLFSPSQVSLRQYYKILIEQPQYLKLFLNSVKYSVGILLGQAVIIPMTAYGLSRFRFKGRDTIRKTTLLLGMFPGFMGMTAVYIIMGQLNLLNSLESLIFYYSCTAPLGYLVQKGYFDSIPYTIHEAATIDGASQLQIFTKITLPLSKPMLVYTALTQFAWPWSDCLLPKLLLKEREMWTVAVGLYSMPDTQFARFAAGSVFIAVPIVILYFCLVKNIVSGLTAGSVKG